MYIKWLSNYIYIYTIDNRIDIKPIKTAQAIRQYFRMPPICYRFSFQVRGDLKIFSSTPTHDRTQRNGTYKYSVEFNVRLNHFSNQFGLLNAVPLISHFIRYLWWPLQLLRNILYTFSIHLKLCDSEKNESDNFQLNTSQCFLLFI